MFASGTIRSALAGGVLLAATLVVWPAQAVSTGSTYTGWVQREDGATSSADRTFAASGADAVLHLVTSGSQIGVYNDGSYDASDSTGMQAVFVAPDGRALQAGQTYRVDVTPGASGLRFEIWRNGTLCGRTLQQLATTLDSPPVATGWFHVSELERDTSGTVTRFAATYEINCQYVGGQPGFEGSVAVNSASPAVPVPDKPTVGPVTDLTVTNVGPNGGGQNTTTLTWTNPVGFGDVNLDLIQVAAHSTFPALLGTNLEQRYRGRGNRYSESMIDFMDTRTYRLVPRSVYGRLGPVSLVTVLGSRFSTTDDTERIAIGRRARFSGRLSESVAYDDPADVLKGPGLVGRAVVLCEQSTRRYVDGACTPVDRGVTGADGRFTLSAEPRQNSMYSVTVRASSDMVGNTTVVFTALVAPRTDLRASEGGTPRMLLARTATRRQVSVRRGSTIHFTTSRARAGSKGLVRLQRFDGKRWRTIAEKNLGRTTSGRLAIPYRERARGRHAYRVVKPADAHHVNGYSQVVYVTVR